MSDFVFSRPDWQTQAACRGTMGVDGEPEFFITRGGDQAGMLDRARKVCKKCEVREDCLEFAIRMNIEVGVWGGMSGNERDKVRAQRGLKGGEDTWRADLAMVVIKAREDRTRLSSLIDQPVNHRVE